jgi:hypothetical protein
LTSSPQPEVLSGVGNAYHTTVTALGYHTVESHVCVWPPHVQVAEIVSPHATDAPINVTATATRAPTNASRLIAVPIS